MRLLGEKNRNRFTLMRLLEKRTEVENDLHTFAPPRIHHTFTILFSIFCLLFSNSGAKFTKFDEQHFFCNSNNLHGEDQILLHAQIFWEFATNILKPSENDFRRVTYNKDEES